MNLRQTADLYQDILNVWPSPKPEPSAQAEWAKVLAPEEQLIAERTLTYLEQEQVQGNPRRFRPSLTEWSHRYRLLDKARQAPSSIVPHECSTGMVEVTPPDGASVGGHWRPCEHCNPQGYERWRNGEYRARIDRHAEPEPDPRVGFGWLDKIRAKRGMVPIDRPAIPVPPSVDIHEEF